ncbi:amino acid ABC transporter ATP-binding protein [Paraburkholderia sediminicola]|uniref:amino acid ABC transporter ATP-binding protein n=1 Tax=Paraburkholderia sediminicola TaxID=458836 RepID=UPI0038B71782
MSATTVAPILETRALRKSYGDVEVLRGIDLAVTRGERIVVMGSSGSGKSTFIRCLNGLEKTASGDILYDGRNITQLNENAWRSVRHRIGMVFQDYSLFPHFTVLRNLLFAPVRESVLSREQAELRANALLKRVGLFHKANAYPCELSGGQQQRVAIVRSMMMQPDLMLFDEPTSALDPETVGEVLAIIDDLTADGLTSIVVTHETGFARRCANRIVFMDQGKILESCPPEVFFDRPATDRARRFIANHK